MAAVAVPSRRALWLSGAGVLRCALVLARGERRWPIGSSLLFATAFLAAACSMLVSVTALFDGYRQTFEDLVLCFVPHLQVTKNKATGLGLFTQDELRSAGEAATRMRARERGASARDEYVIPQDWDSAASKRQSISAGRIWDATDLKRVSEVLNAADGVVLVEPITLSGEVIDFRRDDRAGQPVRLRALLFGGEFPGGASVTSLDALVSRPDLISLRGPATSILLSGRVARLLEVDAPGSQRSVQDAVGTWHPFRVQATFNIGLDQAGTNAVVLPRRLAAQLVGLPADGFLSLGVKLRDRFAAQAKAKQLSGALPRGFSVTPWNDAAPDAFKMMATFRFLAQGIVLLFIVVAAANLRGALFVLVADKRRQLSTLRALGLTRWGVGAAFALIGLVVGSSAALLGVAAGLAITDWAQAMQLETLSQLMGLTRYVFLAEPRSMVLVAFSTVAAAVVFSIGPALAASRISLVRGMRQ